MARFFVNLPLSWIARAPAYLDYFLAHGLEPELGLDAWSLDHMDRVAHQAVAGRLARAGLGCTVHLPFVDVVPGSPDEHMRQASEERLLQALDAARVYGPVLFVGHAWYFKTMYESWREAWVEQSVKTWLALDRAWPGHPPVCLENVMETGPEPLAALMDQLPEAGFGLCLDVGHWHSFAHGHGQDDPGADLAAWVAAMAPRLGHLHLHDNDGSFDQHLGLGLGRIPFAALFAALDRFGLRPGLTLEPHTEEDLAASLDFMGRHPPWFGSM